MANTENDQENKQNEQEGEGNSQSRSGGSGTATQQAPGKGESPASDAYKNETGDPGRTPGSAEGVENFEETGNE